MSSTLRSSAATIISLLLAPAVLAQEGGGPTPMIPAFPGAEGAGMWTPGGRGGKVFVVTNLDDRGPGSLREAAEAERPRIVVFGVAGLITLETPLVIEHPFITIAGQSAPGDGVCVRGETVSVNTHDVVIRYMRFRRGNLESRDDALGGYPIGNIMMDHVSTSWGLDENLSMYRHLVGDDAGSAAKLATENITIQWSISSEALDLNNHAFGGTWGGDPCSFHHNLFACNTGRNPSIGMGGPFDFRNNVLFNWDHRTIDGGDGSSRINIVGNYFKPGPATRGELRHRICRVYARSSRYEFPGFGSWYVEGNVVDGFPEISADNWAGGVDFQPEGRDKDEIIPMGTEQDVRVAAPHPSPAITEHSAEEAYRLVLAHAGASLPRRDAVDARVIETVRAGRPAAGNGLIDSPDEVGGWPEYRSTPAPRDTDGDGMPDDWESSHGLDPNDASDAASDADGDGYTAIEEYLNGTDPTAFVDYTKPEHNRDSLQPVGLATGAE